jgi:hypothetical protein
MSRRPLRVSWSEPRRTSRRRWRRQNSKNRSFRSPRRTSCAASISAGSPLPRFNGPARRPCTRRPPSFPAPSRRRSCRLPLCTLKRPCRPRLLRLFRGPQRRQVLRRRPPRHPRRLFGKSVLSRGLGMISFRATMRSFLTQHSALKTQHYPEDVLPGERSAHEASGLHHAEQLLPTMQHGHSREGIAVYDQQVGVLAGFNRTESLSQSQ